MHLQVEYLLLVTNTNCVVEGNLELVIKRGDIDNKRLVTVYKTTLKEPNLWWEIRILISAFSAIYLGVRGEAR